jgi:hypothetical protein
MTVTVRCTNSIHNSPHVYFLIYLVVKLHYKDGRAVVQAVSRSGPTAAARVGARTKLCGICG